jgi:hypothetical protein
LDGCGNRWPRIHIRGYRTTCAAGLALSLGGTDAGSQNIFWLGTTNRLGTDFFGLRLAGLPNWEYTLEYKTNLEDELWLWRTNITAGDHGLFSFEEPMSGFTTRFYRSVYPPRAGAYPPP